MTNAEARCNKSLRPRKPEGSLGRTAQDFHLDSHTAPELWQSSRNWEQRYIPSPYGCACAAFSCVQTMVRLPVFGIFNARLDWYWSVHAIAHGDCTDTVRISLYWTYIPSIAAFRHWRNDFPPNCQNWSSYAATEGALPLSPLMQLSAPDAVSPLRKVSVLGRLCCLMSSDVSWHIRDKLRPTAAEAWFSIALRPRKPEGSLGRIAQDGHLDSYTASELDYIFGTSKTMDLYTGPWVRLWKQHSAKARM